MNLKKISDISHELLSRASSRARELGRTSQSNRFAQAAGKALTKELREGTARFSEVDTSSEVDTLWIDLGLPSGTLWRDGKEDGYYNFEEAVERFGNSLPTKEQFQELLDNCDYEWDSVYKGGLFTSKVNGNSIFLPAAGHCNGPVIVNSGSIGYYWSSSEYDSNHAYYIYFGSAHAYMGCDSCDYGQFVILVK